MLVFCVSQQQCPFEKEATSTIANISAQLRRTPLMFTSLSIMRRCTLSFCSYMKLSTRRSVGYLE